MSKEFDAVYDQGVFRPLEPISLPDQARVHLRIEASEEPSRPGAGATNLIGMLADEPELADRIMERVYHDREFQPMRTQSNESDGT